MNFKKDYINYVLFNVINSSLPGYGMQPGGADPILFIDNIRIRKILEKIINSDDIFKITYFVGKTAGLELLYKYLLYISDKIDKSQITVFNLKDNFDYDVVNLKKICEKIDKYTPEESTRDLEKAEEKEAEKSIKPVSTIKIETDKDEVIIPTKEEQPEEEYEVSSEHEEHGLILIENKISETSGDEVFELTEIDDLEDKDETISEEKTVSSNEIIPEDEEKILMENDEIITTEPEIIISDEEEPEDKIIVSETDIITKKEKELHEEEIEAEVTDEPEIEAKPIKEKEQFDFEFEVKKPKHQPGAEEPVKEEAVTNEAYLKFENRFFEDVKILEKLFDRIGKENKQTTITTLSNKMLQSFTEIIEISSELADLTRQLSFDLTADIFYTINIFFTKAIKNLSLLTYERIKLLESSLALITSLIKGEDYLNYDLIVEKIEKLKEELSRQAEKKTEHVVKKEQPEKIQEQVSLKEEVPVIKEKIPVEHKVEKEIEEPKKPDVVYEYNRLKEYEKPADKIQPEEKIMAKQVPREQQPRATQSTGDMDSVLFKMKHFVREFEKTFISLGNIKGEYSKFDALEKIDDLNNWLRMIARISSSVKMKDSLKLAEVSYIFLKYVKDYRMDLMDSEIQQILKYIIFTFKMLLTDRRPEDFNVLVQYLNNPVQIFTD